MKVLAFDTAMGVCSAALLCDGAIEAYRLTDQARGHAETVMDMVADILAETGSSVADMDRLGVTIGPGTFTGQRIGLAAARAMVLGTRIQLVGVTTLQAVAAGVDEAGPGDRIGVVFDARRGEVYVQLFDAQLAEVSEPHVLAPDMAAVLLCQKGGQERLILVGTGTDLVHSLLDAAQAEVVLSEASAQPDSRHVARLAAKAEVTQSGVPSPLYLRAPDAKLPGAPPFMTGPALDIVSAGPPMAALCAHLHQLSFESAWGVEAFERMLTMPQNRGLIAQVDEQPVGLVVFQIAGEDSDLVTLCVAPEWRHRGIASGLYVHGERLLAGLGVTSIFLEVAEDNQAARGLYASLGFEKTGMRPDYYARQGENANAIIMRRCLLQTGSATL